MAEFTRSIAAQSVAKCIIDSASAAGIIDGPVAVAPQLAESEKELIVKMLAALRERFNADSAARLHADEVSSLFTFVYGKAAEAVTNMFNNQPDNFDVSGMLDGRVSVYAEERLTANFKASEFPGLCAENYLQWAEDNADELAETDPLLLLFEALKWCFRLSCNYAVNILNR